MDRVDVQGQADMAETRETQHQPVLARSLDPKIAGIAHTDLIRAALRPRMTQLTLQAQHLGFELIDRAAIDGRIGHQPIEIGLDFAWTADPTMHPHGTTNWAAPCTLGSASCAHLDYPNSGNGLTEDINLKTAKPGGALAAGATSPTTGYDCCSTTAAFVEIIR
jgi:hypothetical protein